MSTRYEVDLLHRRPDLVNATAELINQEWSRSLAARIASIDGGCDELPCSLVLVGRVGGSEEGRVVGHARVMPVAGASRAAIIETVVVSVELRGSGLGRHIMEASEQHCLKMGYERIHLSTHDKQGFYSHIGYVSGPQVSPLRKCMAKLDAEQTDTILSSLTGSSTVVREDGLSEETAVHDQFQSSEPLPETTPTSVLAPPPPPLPSRMLQAKQTRNEMIITWMQKILSVS